MALAPERGRGRVRRKRRHRLRVLGIETSCDETAAAVVEDGRVLSNVISSQIPLHRPYLGVVPELASRAHMEKIAVVIEEALQRAGRAPEAIAFTRGPGLAGALLVGKVAAQTLAAVKGLPLLGVHHLEGHIFAAELAGGRPPGFPYIALIVSGGHTDLVLVRGYGRYRVLGRTRDDAAGEAFDKVAKLLGLGFPGGPAVDKRARLGDPGAVKLPRPLLAGCWDFSFSGLKTAVLYALRDRGLADPQRGLVRQPSERLVSDLCASFQEAVVDTLVERTFDAARRFKARGWVLGGGVAANSRLRERFAERAAREGLPGTFPPPSLCTDNGAMIARTAEHRLRRGGGKSKLAVEPSLPFENWG